MIWLQPKAVTISQHVNKALFRVGCISLCYIKSYYATLNLCTMVRSVLNIVVSNELIAS